MSGKTITLDSPLVFEGARFDALVLAEPLAGQVIAAEKAGGAEQGAQAARVRDATLLAQVAGVPAAALRLLPAAVFREAAAYLNGFSVAPTEEAPVNADPDLVLPIDPPIEKHNRVFDVLELRPPTCGEAEAAERELGSKVTAESVRRYQVMLVARVSGLPRYAIEALRISTLDEASRYLVGFM